MANFYVPGSKEYYDRFLQSPPSNAGGVQKFTDDPKFQEIANKTLVDNYYGPMPVGGAQTQVPGGVYRTNKDGITFFPDTAITNTPKKDTNSGNSGGGSVTKDPYADYRGTLDDLYNKVMGYGSYTPGRYSAKYDTSGLEGQLQGWLNEIDNYGDFEYDLNADLLYKQMADNYVQQGQMAMQDAMAQAAAMTGGYGNSYAAAVGNQAYQQHLTQLNNSIPALQQQALNVWQAGLDQLYGQLDAGSQQLNNLLNLEAQNFAQWQANEQNAYNAWLANYNQVMDQYNLGVDYIGQMQALNKPRGGGSRNSSSKTQSGTTGGQVILPSGTVVTTTPAVTNPMTNAQYAEILDKYLKK